MKNLVLTILLAISVVGCSQLPKVTPHYLDTQLMELREYEIVDVENLKIKFKQAHKITPGLAKGYGNGFFAIPGPEAARLKKYCLDRNCSSQGFLDAVSAAVAEQEDKLDGLRPLSIPAGGDEPFPTTIDEDPFTPQLLELERLP